MKEKNNIITAKLLTKELKRLHLKRKRNKKRSTRGMPLKKADRKLVLDKTNSKCHICGQNLKADNFEADHVRAHIGGGSSTIDNYLPSCSTCNNYRWHYLPKEIHWILKIGVWAKTQIENQTTIGNVAAEAFMKHEARRVKQKLSRKG